MKPQRRPRTTLLGRLLSGWRLDRNPLRRGSDRAETVMLGVLLAAFLVGAPFAAHAAGSWIFKTSAGEARVQQAAVRLVPAVLLQAVPSWSSPYGADADARWKAPDGHVCTGPVFAPSGAAAGSTVMVWVNQAGQLTNPPLQSTQITTRVDLAEWLAVAALAGVLILVGRLARWALDKRRLAGWDADWLTTGPRWSPHR